MGGFGTFTLPSNTCGVGRRDGLAVRESVVGGFEWWMDEEEKCELANEMKYIFVAGWPGWIALGCEESCGCGCGGVGCDFCRVGSWISP